MRVTALAALALFATVTGCNDMGSQIITPYKGIGSISSDTSAGDGVNPGDAVADVPEPVDTAGDLGHDVGLDVPGVDDLNAEELPPLPDVSVDVDDIDLGPVCSIAADCAGFGERCADAVCADGHCVVVTAPNGTACDDGDGCTVLDACAEGVCDGGLFICPCKTDAGCAKFEDANVCNGTLVCTPEGCAIDQKTIALCKAPPSGSCEAVQCNGSTGQCETVPANSGEVCDGSGPCAEVSFCSQGECTKSVVDACDDGNPCTMDSCDLDCAHTAVKNGTLCSDGDPCTTSDACNAGVCGGTAGSCPATCTTDLDCEPANDGDLCNGLVRCLGDAGNTTCAFDPKSVVACSDAGLGPCQATWCNPTNGACVIASSANGLSCDDGDACSKATTCLGGQCAGGSAVACDDGNACTTNTCDQTAGCVASLVVNGAACSDGNSCTEGDACLLGICRPGANACNCTADGDCDGKPGFDLCAGTPVCVAGHCELAPGAGPSCVAPDACHSATCDPATGACSIVLEPAGTVCDDANACTAASECVGAACVATSATDCDDMNPCTNDFCAPNAGCVHTAASGACTDDNTCTVGDSCFGGACVAGQNVCPCASDGDCATFEDGNLCNATLECDEGAGHCVPEDGTAIVCPEPSPQCQVSTCNPASGACVVHPAFDGSSCTDGSDCTLDDVCFGGGCVGTGLTSCDDGNPCTTDVCIAGGGCSHNATVALCDDGDPCTVGDACDAGACKPGTANPACACAVDADCAVLDDKNACNGTLSCQAGACATAPGTIVVCDGAASTPCSADLCNPATGACTLSTAPEGTPCTDKNACTTGDTCHQGLCAGGPALNCNDGNACTSDSCKPATGCAFKLNSGSCDDGDPCTTKDKCLGGQCKGLTNVCECAGNADCASLNDADLCVGEYVCTASGCVPGPKVVCAPASASGCLQSLCDKADGLCKDAFTAAGTSCSDGDVCTTSDSCAGGACAGIAPASDACSDGSSCTDDTCDPVLGCMKVANTNPCSDGVPCTQNDTCVGGTCVGTFTACDDVNVCTTDTCEATGCVYTDNVLPCTDNDVCTTNDGCTEGACKPGILVDCNDQNPCTLDGLCSPLTGLCSAPTNLSGTPCSDGNECSSGDACGGGACLSVSETSCDDENPCTDDTCDDALGCQHASNIASCDDAAPCTTDDTCTLGACVGTFDDCDDDNVCTTDACLETGCENEHNVLPCPDADLCTTGDTCAGGECLSGSPTTCDDLNDCTTDGACVPATGLCTTSVPLSGSETCKDLPCTGPTCCCSQGVCTPENLPAFSCQ